MPLGRSLRVNRSRHNRLFTFLRGFPIVGSACSANLSLSIRASRQQERPCSHRYDQAWSPSESGSRPLFAALLRISHFSASTLQKITVLRSSARAKSSGGKASVSRNLLKKGAYTAASCNTKV